jgi:hypothetical protein
MRFGLQCLFNLLLLPLLGLVDITSTVVDLAGITQVGRWEIRPAFLVLRAAVAGAAWRAAPSVQAAKSFSTTAGC